MLARCRRRGLLHPASVAPALLALLLCDRATSCEHDLWPLVKHAESALSGTLMAVEEGDADRLLHIAVAGGAGARDGGGPEILRLIERAGRLPDASELRPGSTGVFLYVASSGGSTEFDGCDGWLLAGGFAPIAAPGAAEAIRTLRAEPSTGARPPPAALIALLDMEEPPARGLAVSWLRRNEVEPEPATLHDFAARFAEETAPEVLAAWLELFLARGWPLAGERASDIVLGADPGSLLECALEYLVRHGSSDEMARLLAAYPTCGRERRVILLEAYARLELREASVWWQAALLGDDRVELEAALAGMAAARIPGSEGAYRALLRSDDAEVRRLALRGLAGCATPSAGEAIRDWLARAEPADPLALYAERLLAKPHRYARTAIRQERRPEATTEPRSNRR